tara:strand:+ start:570 stop:887 length:318 start_codon:yes stop_codon:yes gene_type:complete
MGKVNTPLERDIPVLYAPSNKKPLVVNLAQSVTGVCAEDGEAVKLNVSIIGFGVTLMPPCITLPSGCSVIDITLLFYTITHAPSSVIVEPNVTGPAFNAFRPVPI